MRRGTALLVVTLGFATTAATPSCDTRRTDSLRALAQGMDHYRQGRQTQALKSFTEAVNIDDGNDLAHYYTGLLAFHQFQDLGTARKHLKKALDLDPSQAEYQYQYAAILQSDGQAEAAVPFLQAALERNPKHGQAYYRMGIGQRAKGQLRPAAQSLAQAIELSPRFDKAYVELGDLYLTAGHAKEAAQVLQNCTQNSPQGPECFNEYGRALIGLGDRKAAIAAFNDALARRPGFSGALFNVGMAYRDEGDARKSKFYLERYLKGADRSAERDRIAAAEQIIGGM